MAQVFYSELCEISKNIFSYKTPPVAASVTSCFQNYSLAKKNLFKVNRSARDLDTLSRASKNEKSLKSRNS